MKKRIDDPWMPAPVYGRSLEGLTVNLLVRDIDAARPFHAQVLGGFEVYADPDFAVIRREDAEWMLHADHTYDDHPLLGRTRAAALRGAGIELRLHGADPDGAAKLAAELGFEVLEPPTDKPHGLRETYIVDGDGYVWVLDRPSEE